MEALAKFIPEKPENYGFGNEIMKQTKVCSTCGSVETVSRSVCGKCGGQLPAQSLFQLHQSRNRLCSVCNTILTPRMQFCPQCGKKVKK